MSSGPLLPFKTRELTLGGILDDAITLCKGHFALLLKITLLAFVPWFVAFQVVAIAVQDRVAAVGPGGAPPLPEVLVGFFVILLPMMLVHYGLLTPLTMGAVAIAAQQAYDGGVPTLRGAVRRALRCGLSLVAAHFLWMMMAFILPLGLFFVLVFFIAAGSAMAGDGALVALPIGMFAAMLLWLAAAIAVTWLCFVIWPAIVVENTGPLEAFGRSYALMRRHFVTVFGLALVMFAVRIGVGFGAQLGVTVYLQAVLGSFAQAGLLILEAVVSVVCFSSVRCSRENLDLMQLARRVAKPDPDEAPAEQPFGRVAAETGP